MMKDSSRMIGKIIEKILIITTYFNDVLENKVRRNLVVKELADDIAILGFDIENQSVDNFEGLYSVEYFNDN